MPRAYYNEHDPYAAQWLRHLIVVGAIAPGDVDERSILDVRPGDLAGYTQCHFFAGVGVWSYALRSAGWPDDRPVWTGSCPCQPFSTAGKGAGFDDERHLWPVWFQLIAQCCPDRVFGEQVASNDGLAWLDLVHADLEAADYAVGAKDLCAAGVGAPHIRQRLYFVADRNGAGLEVLGIEQARGERATSERGRAAGIVAHAPVLRFPEVGGYNINGTPESGTVGALGNTNFWIPERRPGEASGSQVSGGGQSYSNDHRPGHAGASAGGLAHNDDDRCAPSPVAGIHHPKHHVEPRGPTRGHWADAEWIYCRDDKWRPVEPGTFPLAHGAPSRVGRLRAYGNAIVAPLAETFTRSYLTRNL